MENNNTNIILKPENNIMENNNTNIILKPENNNINITLKQVYK